MLHLSNESVQSCLGLLPVASNRIDSEADVQWLLKLVVECRPFIRWHDLELPIVSLKLHRSLLTLLAYASITLFGFSLLLLAFLLLSRLSFFSHVKSALWNGTELG